MLNRRRQSRLDDEPWSKRNFRKSCLDSRFKIQIHLFVQITWFQHELIHWHWLWTIVEFYPCLLLITVDMEILIKERSRCHKDHHKWKRSDSPCNTGCFTVLRTRFKYMWPRAVKKVGRVIFIAFNWALSIEAWKHRSSPFTTRMSHKRHSASKSPTYWLVA